MKLLERIVATVFSARGLRWTLPMAVVALLIAAAAFAHFEQRSFGEGVWWALVTITTVGYGDLIPITTMGKLVGAALMLGGIGFLVILAGALVEHFVAVEKDEDEVLRRLERLSAQVDELTRAVRERSPRED